MEVDFRNSSMSYQRYDNLVTTVALLFGYPNKSIPSERDLTDTILPFGYLNTSDKDKIRFIFRGNTPKSIQKWCNDPYSENLSHSELQEIANILIYNKDNIECDLCSEDTINQFVEEIISCIMENDIWCIS